MAVTEAEWLTSPDPKPMLEFLRGKTSDRKMRLFAIACWLRKVTDPENHRTAFTPEHLTPLSRGYYEAEPWCVWADARTLAAVEVAERFYDGRATEAELRDAERLLVDVSEGGPSDAECEAANAAAEEGRERELAPVRHAASAAEDAENQADLIFHYAFDDDPCGYRFSAKKFASEVVAEVGRACEATTPFAELRELANAAQDAAARAVECASEIEGVDFFEQNWQAWPKQVWDHFAATRKGCRELRWAADALVQASVRESTATELQRTLLERLYASGAARNARVVIEREPYDREPWNADDNAEPNWWGGGRPVPAKDAGWHVAREALGLLTGEQAAALMRCVFGNPYRPAAADPAWVTSTVAALCRGIYESRDFAALPILADALQDAGCEDEPLLGHCRGPGPHACGCWVVDLLLGRE